MNALEQSDQEAASVAVAPRVSLKDIEAAIKYRFDLNAADVIGSTHGHIVERDGSSSMDATKILSICVLVMANGFTIIGHAAPASPENFNAEFGKNLAYENAVKQLWPLMGFALRDRLHTAAVDKAASAEPR